MARNQEKAQSMLFRFREAQASSLGLGSSKNLRRPRLASSVTSLKECEKWRGEVLREISRKVSKIQDFGLTDYEVRDLNDEINKLLREKYHWENQILALGGANYKRGVPSMLDDSGREVRGTRGYKYFGRAKDLPGVKELFERAAQEQDDEQQQDARLEKFRRFQDLPAEYYGDHDEDDGVLLAQEQQHEEEEWSEKYADVLRTLHSDDDNEDDIRSMIPSIPRRKPQALQDTIQAFQNQLSMQYSDPSAAAAAEQKDTDPSMDAPPTSTAAKRKSTLTDTTDSDPTPATPGKPKPSSKRLKSKTGHPIDSTPPEPAPPSKPTTGDIITVSYSIFDPSDLAPPPTPDRSAIEKMILQAKKRQLRQEYIETSS